jgi:hypothetical protein
LTETVGKADEKEDKDEYIPSEGKMEAASASSWSEEFEPEFATAPSPESHSGPVTCVQNKFWKESTMVDKHKYR